MLNLKEIFLRKKEKRRGSVGNTALEKPLGESGMWAAGAALTVSAAALSSLPLCLAVC